MSDETIPWGLSDVDKQIEADKEILRPFMHPEPYVPTPEQVEKDEQNRREAHEWLIERAKERRAKEREQSGGCVCLPEGEHYTFCRHYRLPVWDESQQRYVVEPKPRTLTTKLERELAAASRTD